MFPPLPEAQENLSAEMFALGNYTTEQGRNQGAQFPQTVTQRVFIFIPEQYPVSTAFHPS